jgi:hypothetical protein
MTIYCPIPAQGTFISVNGGDYVEYPPGVDVSIEAINVSVYLFSWSYKASFGVGGCSNFQNRLIAVSQTGGSYGYVMLVSNATGAYRTISEMITTYEASNQYPDNCFITPGKSFSIQPTATSDTECGNTAFRTNVYFDGQYIDIGYFMVNGIPTQTRDFTKYRLKIED